MGSLLCFSWVHKVASQPFYNRQTQDTTPNPSLPLPLPHHHLLMSYPCHEWILFCLLTAILLILQAEQVAPAVITTRKIKPKPSNARGKRPTVTTNKTECNPFLGSWVRDDTYPFYQSAQCATIIDAEFNCQMNGRPDSNYLKYKWKPQACDIPRFDGVGFLTKMRGKTIMFVGDSLGRNQWESLICMISAAVPASKTQIDRRDPLSTFRFMEYGVTVSFYRATYLVDVESVEGKRVLNLEKISDNGKSWLTADVLSFNTGHWWTHKGNLQGWDYMQLGGYYYEDMDRLAALDKGLRTWSNWVDTNLDVTKTRVFFQSVSPTHYNPSEWTAGATSTKSCYGETVPTEGTKYPGAYPNQMNVLTNAIRDMRSPVYLLDITRLSELRKDGHPSIYGGTLSPGQRANPDRASDCSHWCLPGLPDTWNQLFYNALMV